MKAINLNGTWRTAGAAAIAAGALVTTIGCGTRDGATVSAQSIAPAQAGLPVMVSCEPHQRALVRPVVVNGSTVSQIECVAAAPAPAVQPATVDPVALSPQPAYRAVQHAQPVFGDVDDGRVVQASYPARTAARPVQTREVVYREAPKPKRSVKKSAVIIGSSAGVGAGVGAAVGGKKGALIGAAIGGGSAAIWDQVTRR